METAMKLGLLAGGLVLVMIPRAVVKKLARWHTVKGTTESLADSSLAGPRLVGVACVLLSLLSLLR